MYIPSDISRLSVPSRCDTGMHERTNGIHLRQTSEMEITAVDGSNETLLLRIDSTLNTAAMKLDPGSIAKVTSSFPVYFNYGDEKDDRCAIVVRKFELVGKHDVPNAFLNGGGSRKPIKLRKRKAEEVPQSPSQNGTYSAQPPCCNGSLCSKNGVVFNVIVRSFIACAVCTYCPVADIVYVALCIYMFNCIFRVEFLYQPTMLFAILT